MPALIFAPLFAPLVAAGSVRQTIRRTPKRPIHPGDVLYLRRWRGAAYHSLQVDLGAGTLTSVDPIRIEVLDLFSPFASPVIAIEIAGVEVPAEDLDAFARADGFFDAAEMAAWYSGHNASLFEGVLIRWNPFHLPGKDAP